MVCYMGHVPVIYMVYHVCILYVCVYVYIYIYIYMYMVPGDLRGARAQVARASAQLRALRNGVTVQLFNNSL